MDFLLALEGNQPMLAYDNLLKVLILFALLGNREYVEMILLQLLLMEYHKITEHPHVEIFGYLLQLLVGEDIELGNRALSHASIRNSRRSDLEQLSAYRMLRFLRISGVQFGEDMMEYKDIVKGNRRYDVSKDETLAVVRNFFTGILNEFDAKTFQHYKIPHKFQKKSQRIPPPYPNDSNILILLSANVDSLKNGPLEKQLMEVHYAGAYDWMYFVELCMKKLFNKRRDIATKISVETLEYIQKNAERYVPTGLPAYIAQRKGGPAGPGISPAIRENKKRKRRQSLWK